MAEILGVRIDSITSDELTNRLQQFLTSDHPHKIFTPNAEILLEAWKQADYRACLNQGDLNLADGVSIVFASRLLAFLNKISVQRLNTKSSQTNVFRATGVDTLGLLCGLAAENNQSILLYGAGPGIAVKAAAAIKGKFPTLSIQGFDPGPVDNDDLASAAFPPDTSFDIIAVALGHPKQEQYICSMAQIWPSVKVAIGVGGALDYLSGNVRRAPPWMRRAGLEWLYRLIQQPRRMKRIFNAVVVFPLVVVWDRMRAL